MVSFCSVILRVLTSSLFMVRPQTDTARMYQMPQKVAGLVTNVTISIIHSGTCATGKAVKTRSLLLLKANSSGTNWRTSYSLNWILDARFVGFSIAVYQLLLVAKIQFCLSSTVVF